MKGKNSTRTISYLPVIAIGMGVILAFASLVFAGTPMARVPAKLPSTKAFFPKGPSIQAKVTGFKVLTYYEGMEVYIKNSGTTTIPGNTLGVRIYQKRKNGTGTISGTYYIGATIEPGNTHTTRLPHWKLDPQTRSITVHLLKLANHKTIFSLTKPFKAFDVTIEEFSWNNADRSWTLKITNHMDVAVRVSYYVNATNNYYHVKDWGDRPLIGAHRTCIVTQKTPLAFHYRANADGSTRTDRITAEVFTYDKTGKTYILDKKEIDLPCVPNPQNKCQ